MFAVPMLGALAFILKAMPVEGEGLRALDGLVRGKVRCSSSPSSSRSSLTVSGSRCWALEGPPCVVVPAVPHPGLRGLGCVLLGVAFIRLALNPAVLNTIHGARRSC
jgi:hypothetical protein